MKRIFIVCPLIYSAILFAVFSLLPPSIVSLAGWTEVQYGLPLPWLAIHTQMRFGGTWSQERRFHLGALVCDVAVAVLGSIAMSILTVRVWQRVTKNRNVQA